MRTAGRCSEALLTTQSAMCGGRAYLRGMPIRVSEVLELRGAGATFGESLEEHPYVKREANFAAIQYAARRTDQRFSCPPEVLRRPTLPILSGVASFSRLLVRRTVGPKCTATDQHPESCLSPAHPLLNVNCQAAMGWLEPPDDRALE